MSQLEKRIEMKKIISELLEEDPNLFASNPHYKIFQEKVANPYEIPKPIEPVNPPVPPTPTISNSHTSSHNLNSQQYSTKTSTPISSLPHNQSRPMSHTSTSHTSHSTHTTSSYNRPPSSYSNVSYMKNPVGSSSYSSTGSHPSSTVTSSYVSSSSSKPYHSTGSNNYFNPNSIGIIPLSSSQAPKSLNKPTNSSVPTSYSTSLSSLK